jgi:hypothetical protein
MKKALVIAVAASLGFAGAALAAGQKKGFASFAGASSNPAQNTHNQGTTTGPKGALKNGKTTPNQDLPGKAR